MKNILIVIILSGLMACSNNGKSGNNLTDKQESPNLQKDWVEYKEPNIFSIEHPEGWTVLFNKKKGRIKLSKGNNEIVYIWPLYSQEPLNNTNGSRLLKKLVLKIGPGLLWSEPEPGYQNSLVLRGSNKSIIGSACLRWISNQNNSAVICYVITAPKDNFEKDKDNLVSILTSFRPVISGNNKSPDQDQPSMQFMRWQDPNEKAFTVEVPKNWHVQGGLVRYSPTDYRRGVNLISPDGRINVFFMDPNIPFFSLPNQTLSMTGFVEGTYYPLTDGTRTFVRRYVRGVNFAYEYAGKRFSNELNNFTIWRNRNRPDIARIDNRENIALNTSGQGMIRTNVTAGEVYFKGNKNGQLYSGYVEAATSVTTAYGGGIWFVQQLYGFNAPQSSEREAAIVMRKLVSSFMWNPQWFMMQNKITANVSQIVAKTGEEISKIINSSFELNQKIQDRAMQKFSDYILDAVTLKDADGQKFHVWNTSNFYWANQFNDVAGTKFFKNPNISQFRRLFEVK